LAELGLGDPGGSAFLTFRLVVWSQRSRVRGSWKATSWL